MSTKVRKYIDKKLTKEEANSALKSLFFLTASAKGYPEEFSDRFFKNDGRKFTENSKMVFNFGGAIVTTESLDFGCSLHNETFIHWDDLMEFLDSHPLYIEVNETSEEAK